MPRPIERMLDLSTGHIRASTADALGQDQIRGTLWDRLSYVFWHEYGWIIFVPDASDDADLLAQGFDDLVACLRLARESGCQYLKLDCDAPSVDELPTYDW